MNQNARRAGLILAYISITAVLLLAVWAVCRNHRTRIALDAAELRTASQKIASPQPGDSGQETDEPDELSAMLSTWTEQVFEVAAANESLKKIVAKYPLVVLHSRQLFGSVTKGRYRQSSFSLNYGTWDERKHGNDVQLQFHNGGEPASFQVNMLGGQHNLVRDLGPVEFEEDIDPTTPDIDDPSWKATGKAIVDHVFHLRVRDEAGNRFHVLFKAIAVDPDSKYMAFCWRILPNAKLVAPPR